MSSTNNSASDGNSDEPQPPAKKTIKASDVNCSAIPNYGNQRIIVHPPSNSSYTVMSLSNANSVTENMLRPSAPVCVSGSELPKSLSLYNQQLQSHLALNQKQPCVQQKQPVQQHQQSVPLVQKQVANDGNQNYNSQPTSNSDISSGGRAIDGGRGSSLIDSKDMEISFDNFPYYLSERTKYHLVASYFIHACHKGHTSKPDTPRAKRRILLSGPEGSEIYQETLAVALTHHFGARLLVLDCSFNVNILSAFGQPLINDAWKFHLCTAPSKYLWGSKYGSRNVKMPKFSNAVSHLLASQPTLLYEKSRSLKIGDRVIFTGLNFGGIGATIAPRGPTFGNRGTVLTLGNSNSNRVGVRFDMPIPEGNNLAGLCEAHNGFFVDESEVCIDLVNQVKPISSPFKDTCADCRLVLFVKHAGNCILENFAAFQGIHCMVNKLPENVFVIGSHILKKNTWTKENFYGNKEPKLLDITKMLLEIFQDEINIDMPEDPKLFDVLKHRLDQDAELLKVLENRALFHQVLIQHGLECEDVEMVDVKDRKMTDGNAEKVVKLALGYEIMVRTLKYINSKLVLSRESILYGLENLRDTQTDKKNSRTFPKEFATDNEYEKMLLAEVILHDEIGVKFDDIGALDNIKDTLKELVMLPLQRPELFFKGQLRKPCRGILLFGPSGTGKTMLAKAVATEARANFLNISAYSITSKWYGESEKYVKAIFSLASKIAPSVVFIDEVDSLLGMRRELEHEVTRKVKNEFMLNWDGLLTKDKERVLVLAATNRPFDLDEAVIRRLPRRLMVNLPDAANRSKILKVILAKEDLSPNVDFDAIARMTEGFSGSDLKNLCIAAAHRPVREILKKEKYNSQQLEEAKSPDFPPLDMEDFKYACKQVRASLPTDSKMMEDLVRWNELYGEGGSPRKRPLSYYI